MKMFLSVLVMFAIGTVVSHAEEDLSMSGEVKGQTIVECVASGENLRVTLSNFPAVRTPEEGNFRGGIGKKSHNALLGKDDFVVYPQEAQGFSGATLYVFGMGKDWQNMPKHVDQLDVSKAWTSARVSNGQATFTVTTKPDFKWYRFNGMIATKNGNGWVGMENQSGYLARDKHNNPLLVIGRGCAKPTDALIAKIAKGE
jgi:hypothetical protein